MTKTTSRADKPKAINGANDNPSGRGNLVPKAIRIHRSQDRALRELSALLMMHESDIIRKGLDLGIAWAAARAKKLSARG